MFSVVRFSDVVLVQHRAPSSKRRNSDLHFSTSVLYFAAQKHDHDLKLRAAPE